MTNYKCKICNGSHVQVLVWAHPDTGLYITDGPGGKESSWCDDCQEHNELIDIDQEQEPDSGDALSDSWLEKADKESEAEKEKS